VFWRTSNETLCRHRCPLFDAGLGIAPTATIALGLFQTLHLGPMQAWCNMVMRTLFTCQMWGLAEATEPERLQAAVFALRAELRT
jgi:hypothetical protein